jgi:tetratricopeptide (TPR) repeat protein
MRLIAFFAAILVWAGAARADQNDPELDKLFEALRSGEGDAEQLMLDIEVQWATAPEQGIAILLGRAATALQNDDYATAALLAGHITGLAPSFAEGWVLKGQAALLEDELIEAEIAFAKAVALETRHYVALEKLGDLALMSGHEERAHRRYREALDWNPTLSDLRERADRLRDQLNGQEI